MKGHERDGESGQVNETDVLDLDFSNNDFESDSMNDVNDDFDDFGGMGAYQNASDVEEMEANDYM